jgi:hypothetical protein
MDRVWPVGKLLRSVEVVPALVSTKDIDLKNLRGRES